MAEVTIAENVGQDLRYGQIVYDNAAEKIGEIDQIDTMTGWLRAGTTPLMDQWVYIPFRAVTSVDPREVFVSISKEELRRQYGNPPAREIEIEQRDGATYATTREPNGFDGSPIVIDSVNMATMTNQVVEGYEVLTSESRSLGTVKRCDRTTGWILVRHAGHSGELLVPVTAVQRVDRQFEVVHLVLAEADLRRMGHLEPADAIFVDTEPLTAVEVQARSGAGGRTI